MQVKHDVQHQEMNNKSMKCLRTILALNIGDRVPNRTILDLSGQAKIEEIIGFAM